MLKGAIHMHSTYSDGEFTLAELREMLLREGCRFVCMTDHAEMFDEATKLNAYIEECKVLSDERFCFIPGLEFECKERMHILSFGAAQLTNTTDPQRVIRHITEKGGISVIAHPMDTAFPWIETFDVLPDGIETWNSKYDGRYAPRTRTFDLLRRLQGRNPKIGAFYGIDLHWRQQYRGLFTHVECHLPTRSAVLSALAGGHYIAIKEGIELPSNGHLSEGLRADFERAHAHSDRLRSVVKVIKRILKQTRVKIPSPIKAQLRRLF